MGFVPAGTSGFLSSLKESHQRKPPKPTVLESLGALHPVRNPKIVPHAINLPVITVGQKDCAGTAFRVALPRAAALCLGRGVGVLPDGADRVVRPYNEVPTYTEARETPSVMACGRTSHPALPILYNELRIHLQRRSFYV